MQVCLRVVILTLKMCEDLYIHTYIQAQSVKVEARQTQWGNCSANKKKNNNNENGILQKQRPGKCTH